MTTDKKYFLLLADQTCIIGSEFQVMKRWRRNYREKAIVDMFSARVTRLDR